MDVHVDRATLLELYKETESRLTTYGWMQRHGYELVFLTLRFLLFGTGFFVFAQPGILFKAGGMLVISYAYYGIGITGTHEARHNCFVKSPIWNHAWAYFFSDFWAGQSNEWWHYRHVVKHHQHTNIPGKETANFYYPWMNKYVYFFLTPYLVTVWMFVSSVQHLRKETGKLIAYVALTVLGVWFNVWLFSLVLPLWWAIVATIVMRSLYAPVFMHLAVFNHIGLDEPTNRPAWITHQTRTTRNVKRNWFLTGMGGNAFVECHLEHHLFPTLSNHVIGRIRPFVKSFLESRGYTYTEEGYFEVLADSLKNYERYFLSGNVTEGVI